MAEFDDRTPIRRSALLVVEGRDMKEFFRALLLHLQLADAVDVRDAGGKEDFADYFLTLPEVSGYDRVASLGVVRDADEDAEKAFQRLCTHLRRARFPVPNRPLRPSGKKPRVTVMILPDARHPGMLESLCWRAIENRSVVPCIDEFLHCAKKSSGAPLRHPEVKVILLHRGPTRSHIQSRRSC